MAREVATHVPDRHVHLIAEDERNLEMLLHPLDRGGYGMTGVWADDFHHAVRRHLAGDDEAWFADFHGTTAEIATAVRDGWVFTGQHAAHYDGPRGTSPAEVPIEAPVICLQNHDQIGNRAHGERLHHQVGEAAWLAATTLLIMAPETPMLFMGQEWAASTPFLFFTDHEPTLGELVVQGRRREFARFATFNHPEARERIPSPQAERTWRASLIDWQERTEPRHAHVLAQTRALLALRHAHVSAHPRDRSRIRCEAVGPNGLWLEQPSARGGRLLTFVDFAGNAVREIPGVACGCRASVHVLFASSTTPGSPFVRDARVEGTAILLDAGPEPFGVVLHLPEARP
jgi:maltooligosyltrehalose trehalohydrolase